MTVSKRTPGWTNSRITDEMPRFIALFPANRVKSAGIRPLPNVPYSDSGTTYIIESNGPSKGNHKARWSSLTVERKDSSSQKAAGQICRKDELAEVRSLRHEQVLQGTHLFHRTASVEVLLKLASILLEEHRRAPVRIRTQSQSPLSADRSAVSLSHRRRSATSMKTETTSCSKQAWSAKGRALRR